MCVWYNNLKSGSIIRFNDLYAKQVAYFSMTIHSKKISIKLFKVIELESESTRVYLKRFNEESLKVRDFCEVVASKALLGEVKKPVI